MSEPYSSVDASGQYLASIVPKTGRSEVQFYPLIPDSTSSKALYDESNVSRHELQMDSDIISVTWLNESGDSADASKKSAKKRPNSAVADEEHENGSTDTTNPVKNGEKQLQNGSSAPANPSPGRLYLAVAFSSGEISTFSPTSDSIISQVSAQEPIVSMTAANSENHIWALGESGSIYEIDVIGGDAPNVVRFGKKHPDVTLLAQCHYKPPKKKRAVPDGELIYVASSRLFLVDGTRSRNHCVGEYTRHNDGNNESEDNLTFLVNIPGNDSQVVVARDDSNVLQLCDVAEEDQAPFSLNCASSDILNVRALGDEYVVAYTSSGAEIFSIKDEITVSPAASVKTSNKKVVFENFFYNARAGLVGIWYDGNQPHFTKISADLDLSGDHVIPITIKDSSDHPEPEIAAEITFVADSEDQISNVSASELSRTLLTLLSERKPSKSAVLSLCAANDDEENIRAAIRHLAYSDDYSLSVERLFRMVSTRVSQDPSKKTSLSLWLKWILLAQGGYISKQKSLAGNLRGLQKSLEEGMSLMPKLLALQGRLSMLKAQAELRNSVGNGDENPETAEVGEQANELEAFNETLSNTTNIEESVVYANGEGDEYEDTLTSAITSNGISGDVDITENGGVDGDADDILYENGEAE